MSAARGILVTGASRGLGLALTGALLADGWRVTAVARRPGEDLAALGEEHGDALHVVTADVTRDGDRVRAVDAAVAHAPLHGLVNNAAVAVEGLVVRQRSEDVDAMIGLNLVAPIELSRLVGRALIRRGAGGRIVSLSSVVARRPGRGLAVYVATKAGLEGFTRALARELGPRDITVNAVAPGYVETDMSATLDAAQRARIAARMPVAAPLTATSVTDAVRFLLSDEAGHVTGTTLPVDGGAGL